MNTRSLIHLVTSALALTLFACAPAEDCGADGALRCIDDEAAGALPFETFGAVALTPIDGESPLVDELARSLEARWLDIESVSPWQTLLLLDLERVDADDLPKLRALLDSPLPKTLLVENARDAKALASLTGFGISADAVLIETNRFGDDVIRVLDRDDAPAALDRLPEALEEGELSFLEAPVQPSWDGSRSQKSAFITNLRRSTQLPGQTASMGLELHLTLVADHATMRKFVVVEDGGSGVTPTAVGAPIAHDNDEKWERGFFQDHVGVRLSSPQAHLRTHRFAPENTNDSYQHTRSFSWSISVNAQGQPTIGFSAGVSTTHTTQDFALTVNSSGANALSWDYDLETVGRGRDYDEPEDVFKAAVRMHSVPDLARRVLQPDFEAIYRFDQDVAADLDIEVTQRLVHAYSEYPEYCFYLCFRQRRLDERDKAWTTTVHIDPSVVQFEEAGGGGPAPMGPRNNPPSPLGAFSQTEGWAIAGHNDAVLYGQSRAECARACLDEAWCRSADYVVSAQRCQLSSQSRDTVPASFAQYPDHVYLHRNSGGASALSQFQQVHGYAIAGHNAAVLHGMSMEGCAQACLDDPNCRSADYVTSASRCQLAHVSREHVGGDYRAYADHVYLHRR